MKRTYRTYTQEQIEEYTERAESAEFIGNVSIAISALAIIIKIVLTLRG